MMKASLICILFLLLAAMLPAQITDPFFLRHSSRCADGNIRLRWEGTGLEECYYASGATAWQQATSEAYSATTRQALLPYGFGQNLRYRLRMTTQAMGETYALMHAPWMDANAFPPPLGQMGLITTDATGDSVSLYAPMLDLTDTWFAVTDTKLYSAMANVSGSFPVMNSFTSYNIYGTLLANPDALQDSLTYAMIYSGIPLILPSGLYKLGLDGGQMPVFTHIASIQTQVSGQKLYLACNIDDLTSDPDFGAWPNSTNSLIVSSATIRATIDISSGDPAFGFGDYGGFGLEYFQNNHCQVAVNSLPVVSGISVDTGTNTLSFSYLDANADFPLSVELLIAGQETMQPLATSLDYTQAVGYTSVLATIPQHAIVRVSDNLIDYVDFSYDNVANPSDTTPVLPFTLQMPNPLRYASAPFQLSLDGLKQDRLQLEVFDLRGRRLGSIYDQRVSSSTLDLAWDGLLQGKALGSGLYFLRVSQGSIIHNHKFIIQE